MLTRGSPEFPDQNSEYYVWQPDEDSSIRGHFRIKDHKYTGGVLETDCFITDFVIEGEENRNQGHGKVMLQELITEARHRGFQRVQLDVLRRNAIAQNVYAKAGFIMHPTYHRNGDSANRHSVDWHSWRLVLDL